MTPACTPSRCAASLFCHTIVALTLICRSNFDFNSGSVNLTLDIHNKCLQGSSPLLGADLPYGCRPADLLSLPALETTIKAHHHALLLHHCSWSEQGRLLAYICCLPCECALCSLRPFTVMHQGLPYTASCTSAQAARTGIILIDKHQVISKLEANIKGKKHLASGGRDTLAALRREIDVMRRLRHRNIVSLHEV